LDETLEKARLNPNTTTMKERKEGRMDEWMDGWMD
jgi:hypothetical protein